jgi:hypothetical protein
MGVYQLESSFLYYTYTYIYVCIRIFGIQDLKHDSCQPELFFLHTHKKSRLREKGTGVHGQAGRIEERGKYK